MAGFECSTHRRPDDRRLDLLAATDHDRLAEQDYRQVAEHGIRTVRDGLRWHLIERTPGRYDWSSFLPQLRAARRAGVQVIWDLCHYGWPDDIDIWQPAFVERFERFVAAVARLVRDEGDEIRFFCPVNEISYFAWAAGDEANFLPNARGRGGELKRQLVRAAIAGIEALRGVDPRSRVVHVDPLIRVRADAYNEFQYEAWDMIAGRAAPELGGRPDHLDLIGLNYYPSNQWYGDGGGMIPLGHYHYTPLRELLAEVHRRYGRPMLMAETGAEGTGRAAWFHYVSDEIRAALEAGLPMEGVCLYPITDFPGWTNDRHCEAGLLRKADEQGRRAVHEPLAGELARQRQLHEAAMRRAQAPHLVRSVA